MLEANSAEARLVAHLIVDHGIEVDELRRRFDDLTVGWGARVAAEWLGVDPDETPTPPEES